MAKNYLDYEGLTTYHGKVKEELAKKVDKVSGKGLSTEDFTTEEKQKLAGITGTGDYVLPAATTTKLGGVMIGEGLTVDQEGKTSLNEATNLEYGGIKLDSYTIAAGENDFSGIKLAGLHSETGGTTKAMIPIAQPDGTAGIVSVSSSSGLQVDANGSLSINPATANISWSGITNKPDIALKSDIANVYKYKGSVETNMDLPTEDMIAGDVYNVEATGMNYAWTGSAWDALGSVFEINSISDVQIEALFSTSLNN